MAEITADESIRPGWRGSLPEGYTLRRIDRDLMADPGLVLPEGFDAGGEIEACWGSVAHFLEKGIGFCVLHGGEVVSHCLDDPKVAQALDHESKQ